MMAQRNYIANSIFPSKNCGRELYGPQIKKFDTLPDFVMEAQILLATQYSDYLITT